MNKLIHFLHLLFGYCHMCRHWFVYPKRRRMNTQYVEDEANYITACAACFEEIEENWEERWKEYWSERL